MKNKLLLVLFFLFYGLNQLYAQSYTITTVAGSGKAGKSGDGGAATAAELYGPIGVAADGNGNIYIADGTNNKIRKVNSSGIITTFAGTGTAGYTGDNAAATDAELHYPNSVTVDGEGNVYIADNGNYVVREVNTSGVITTVAGNGYTGTIVAPGSATSTPFNYLDGVFADVNGFVYISDAGNSQVAYEGSGVIAVVAGDGLSGFYGDGYTATYAKLSAPWSVFSNDSGVFICDFYNERIRKVNNSGIITTIAGTGGGGFSGDGGPATSAQFHYPSGIWGDANGNIYVADQLNNRIRKINDSGTISTIAGDGTLGFSGDGGPATQAELWTPSAITGDGKGNLYIADLNNNRIRKLSVGTGINTLADNKPTVSIFPNPAAKQLNIESNKTIDEIQITNVLGQLVFQTQTDVQNKTFKVDVSALPDGLFFVLIKSGNETIVQKVIIDR